VITEGARHHAGRLPIGPVRTRH